MALPQDGLESFSCLHKRGDADDLRPFVLDIGIDRFDRGQQFSASSVEHDRLHSGAGLIHVSSDPVPSVRVELD